MNDDEANDATVRAWAWTLEGRDDQPRIAWRAALRSVHVWEEVPGPSVLGVRPARRLGRLHDLVAAPRRVLAQGANAEGLDAEFRALLDLQHQLAHGVGWSRCWVAHPPFGIGRGAPRWLWALSSTVHAMAATLWTPDQVPAIDDEVEREAQRAAGPILATVESCVASAIACPSESLAAFVGEVSGTSQMLGRDSATTPFALSAQPQAAPSTGSGVEGRAAAASFDSALRRRLRTNG